MTEPIRSSGKFLLRFYINGLVHLFLFHFYASLTMFHHVLYVIVTSFVYLTELVSSMQIGVCVHILLLVML